MVHEAMVLEYAGPDLALVEMGLGDAADGPARTARQPVRALGHRHRRRHAGVGGDSPRQEQVASRPSKTDSRSPERARPGQVGARQFSSTIAS